ncbi:Peroxisomal coenzyme A diphosphatase 1, peroxisomal [Ilyonectria robusta]
MIDASASAAALSSSLSIEASRNAASAPEPHSGAEISINDADVTAIQNGIRDAATGEHVNLGESSLYYDALTMSPLSPFSAVRLPGD